MVRTTVYLDETLIEALQRAARREGRPQSELIRNAIGQFLKAGAGAGAGAGAEQGGRRLRGVGAYHSGHADTSERAKALLEARAAKA
ncbi:MAG: ribbon-helix-helix domain-containing protein [Salinisphaera sp.]|nr:ribbon-helix-helix domain-containing protein [Salinisphaera sp.]